MRCVGLNWVSMLRMGPVPWARRVWALPWLSALCWPAAKHGRRRHKTRLHRVRPRMQQGRRLVLGVDGGFAAVSLALAGSKSQGCLVARWRWDAARYPRPAPQPPGKRGRPPVQGKRQRRLQGWAARRDTPWETGEGDGYAGQRQELWVFSHTARWSTPGLPPIAIRDVLVGDPARKLRMEAFFGPDLPATPVQIVAWVVMPCSVEVTFAEARAPLGLETQRQWSALAIARTTPVRLALFALVTLLALGLRQGGPIPAAATAWYPKTRAALCSRCGPGASASLARPVLGALCC